MLGLGASGAGSWAGLDGFWGLWGVAFQLRAYVALYFGHVFGVLGVFALSSRGFRQDRQVVAEDRAADGRCEILKAAKTASGQPECPF